MTTLLICTSVAHGNTRRVAEAMAPTLRAQVCSPGEVTASMLDAADVVGFGSGIYLLDFHVDLRGLVESLPAEPRGRAFVFATSGLPEPPFRPYIRRFAGRLSAKGFTVVGDFHCRGFDDWGPFRLAGGICRSRPSDADLQRAETFASRVARG